MDHDCFDRLTRSFSHLLSHLIALMEVSLWTDCDSMPGRGCSWRIAHAV
jgi:hypothetical protein